MRNECHFLASVDISRKCVSCPFDPLTGRTSSGNLRCLYVLYFSFVNAIRVSCVKRHSFLMRWPMESLDAALRVTGPLWQESFCVRVSSIYGRFLFVVVVAFSK